MVLRWCSLCYSLFFSPGHIAGLNSWAPLWLGRAIWLVLANELWSGSDVSHVQVGTFHYQFVTHVHTPPPTLQVLFPPSMATDNIKEVAPPVPSVWVPEWMWWAEFPDHLQWTCTGDETKKQRSSAADDRGLSVSRVQSKPFGLGQWWWGAILRSLNIAFQLHVSIEPECEKNGICHFLFVSVEFCLPVSSLTGPSHTL